MSKMPIDSYNLSIDGQDALKFEPPPTPAPQTNDPNLMRLYVPSENTELDFGAGKTPGIRMATDNHAHLTARSPRTTISLGSPGGDGISKGDPAGLQVYTEGAKRETIDKSTEEWHKDTKLEVVSKAWTARCEDDKTEYIKGVWNQTCDNAKTETVKGTVTEHYEAEHNLTVGKQAVHHFASGKVETVGEDLVVDVKGHKKETVHGDSKNVTGGAQNTLFLGEKLAVTMGANLAVHVGGSYSATLADQRSVHLGGTKFDVVNATAISMNLATKIAKDNVTVSRCSATYSHEGAVKLTKADLEVLTRTNQLTSAAMIIFK